MSTDTLGDRIKRYEAASSHTLSPRTPVMIRVDGRAFHTFTRGCERPFDARVVESMVEAARFTAADMAGFRLAYVQSDEATFLIDDLASLQSQPWFGNKAHKLVSLSASLFTAAFNRAWPGTDSRPSMPAPSRSRARTPRTRSSGASAIGSATACRCSRVRTSRTAHSPAASTPRSTRCCTGSG
ncbi:Uncharacterized conserved protein (plasmid) [Tsukamurella tyrosinosolvens]|uniref:tRNA(His) guanylyltransferase Thg1 family protein n=1 Tax=Tsukamurella tyrosinosolvens TaxID=57704 RepID=UPI000F6BF0E9|nr:tRNA(His) guanylyltransferase Thg1 family protein [Tsukamurella tyrosinosolvens]VEH94157.1 Uncharacterized conserved protein [Tsukamurella tyrosinosolvens]